MADKPATTGKPADVTNVYDFFSGITAFGPGASATISFLCLTQEDADRAVNAMAAAVKVHQGRPAWPDKP